MRNNINCNFMIIYHLTSEISKVSCCGKWSWMSPLYRALPQCERDDAWSMKGWSHCWPKQLQLHKNVTFSQGNLKLSQTTRSHNFTSNSAATNIIYFVMHTCTKSTSQLVNISEHFLSNTYIYQDMWRSSDFGGSQEPKVIKQNELD